MLHPCRFAARIKLKFVWFNIELPSNELECCQRQALAGHQSSPRITHQAELDSEAELVGRPAANLDLEQIGRGQRVMPDLTSARP